MLNFAESCYLSKFNGLLLRKLAQKDNSKVSLYEYPDTIIARFYIIIRVSVTVWLTASDCL